MLTKINYRFIKTKLLLLISIHITTIFGSAYLFYIEQPIIAILSIIIGVFGMFSIFMWE